jgi:hypothetical protein
VTVGDSVRVPTRASPNGSIPLGEAIAGTGLELEGRSEPSLVVGPRVVISTITPMPPCCVKPYEGVWVGEGAWDGANDGAWDGANEAESVTFGEVLTLDFAAVLEPTAGLSLR